MCRHPAMAVCRVPPPLRGSAAVSPRRTVEGMSSDHSTDPDPYAEHPDESAFPAAGERVSDEDRQRALDAQPGGNATVGDTVATDDVDSDVHEDGPESDEVVEQVRED